MSRAVTVNGCAVVIVDSWPMVRLGVARVCQSAGMRVIDHSGDPVEGLAVARARHADLLILGRHDGAQAEVIRKAKAVQEVPAVLVMARLAGRSELVALLSAGADGIVLRSVGADELVDSAAKVLAGERVVSPALIPGLAGMREVEDGGSGADMVLTERQREVLARLADGLGNDQIAKSMYISAHTVKSHLSQIYSRLGVKTRHEALAQAVARGILS